MAFCNQCGTEVPEGSGFCHLCGTPLAVTDEKKVKKSQVPDEPEEDDKFKTRLRKKPVYGVVNLENLPEGHIIDDRYEVKGKLGQGGFGAVYRVFDKKMKIDKALKVLPEAITNDREAMESLGEEAATMVRLNHPNIVRVFDFQEKGRIKYIDMEFVDGKSLTDVKIDSADKKLAEAEVKKLASGIATGLAYAHSKNVIHKDIKPQNILLSKTGEIKIMDFGISETVRNSMSRVENSSSSGTLTYMPPEQIKGMNIGKEADVYSFGAMLYELLSGKTPFYKGDISYQVINEKPGLIKAVSPDMNQFLQKCLAKDYKARFRNFEEVQRALNGEAVSRRLGGNSGYFEKKERTPSLANNKGIMISIIAVLSIILIIAIALNIKKASNLADKQNAAASAVSVNPNPYTSLFQDSKKTVKSKHVIQKTCLYVNAAPKNAQIKILNIKPVFTQGISLAPGNYHLSVSAKGYATKNQWVELLEDQTKNLDVRLKKKINHIFTNSLGMSFVYIKADSFNMGSNNGGLDEKPVYRVTLTKGYYMQTTEVTQGQWETVMGTTPWSGKNYVKANRNNPAVYISWANCKEFVQKLNKKEGVNGYRLPTEAEWEFAARGSSSSKYYCFGDNVSQLGNYVWYDKNAWNVGEKYAHGVALKKANQFGLYDMHGNVWEWCEDLYGNYPSGNVTDPVGVEGSSRVGRGGGWGDGASRCRSAIRDYFSPGYRGDHLGFRLARTP